MLIYCHLLLTFGINLDFFYSLFTFVSQRLLYDNKISGTHHCQLSKIPGFPVGSLSKLTSFFSRSFRSIC